MSYEAAFVANFASLILAKPGELKYNGKLLLVATEIYIGALLKRYYNFS